MEKQILKAISNCIQAPQEPLDFWIRKYHYNTNLYNHKNHFILMMKPELTRLDEEVRTEEILSLINERLSAWDIDVKAVRVISSSYLKKFNLIEKHYGVLNRISRKGLQECSKPAISKIRGLYPNIDENNILGGHQFLEAFEDFSAFSLEVLHRNLVSKKLGNGTYAIKTNIDGTDHIILNAFHPCQVDWFTKPGNAVVVFECLSTKDMGDIRQKVMGATNPNDAEKGSIKYTLLENKERFGLRNVTTRFNGIHLSPGPVEGMFSVIRYFSDYKTNRIIAPKNTCFGNMLIENNYNNTEIMLLEKNPYISTGDIEHTLFDATEDKDWDYSLSLVQYFLNDK